MRKITLRSRVNVVSETRGWSQAASKYWSLPLARQAIWENKTEGHCLYTIYLENNTPSLLRYSSEASHKAPVHTPKERNYTRSKYQEMEITAYYCSLNHISPFLIGLFQDIALPLNFNNLFYIQTWYLLIYPQVIHFPSSHRS